MEIIEKRGRKKKYTFGELYEVGMRKSFRSDSGLIRTSTILSSAKRYCKENKLKWKFRCFTEGKSVVITRIR